MRLGIKAKQIAAVTAIVGLAVVTLSAVHVARLARVVLHESQARGELLANTIFHRAREVVVSSIGDPYALLRSDPGLRAMLEASIYGESVTGAAILDKQGIVRASSDPAQEGKPLPPRDDLASLVAADSVEQLRVIYSQEGRTLEVRQQMVLGDEPFGSIRIGVSTVLMRQELDASLRPALNIALASLLIAVIVAALLAQLFLRPINVIRSGLTRLGKGEFGVTLDLNRDDEFGELGTFFNAVSQQLSADRSLLAGQKANLQSAVEHLEDAVALFNPSGELLFSNPAMQPKLPADAIGRALRGLLPDGDPYRTIVEETLATRTSRGPIQISAGIGDQGSPDPYPNLLMTHAIEGTDGQLVGVLLVSRNLAYLSRMQSTIAYSRKLVALGRLTAGIAHEVKNPLNAMMIHLELLRTKIRRRAAPKPEAVVVGGLGLAEARSQDHAKAEEADALQHVEVIESEIRRLDEVVQGFLKFTRPEDLRLQPVRVKDVFDEILPIIAPEAQKNSVRVTIDAPAGGPWVNGDAAMLRQAFLNLAINACQAMPDGGTLRMTCGPAPGDRVEVRFEDTGVGIPAEHLSKIFDLYFTTKDHGTGIGLSMVYRIIQLHDGDVEVESTKGRGTTFRVLLPRANES
ncbi:MAG TPA: ATP-binding protein [Vicinamibacterales bacterium]|jgi:signal transduction histidine kinase